MGCTSSQSEHVDPVSSLESEASETEGNDTRPDGKKKAYVRLTLDHDALDVANKVGARVAMGIRSLTCV